MMLPGVEVSRVLVLVLEAPSSQPHVSQNMPVWASARLETPLDLPTSAWRCERLSGPSHHWSPSDRGPDPQVEGSLMALPTLNPDHIFGLKLLNLHLRLSLVAL